MKYESIEAMYYAEQMGKQTSAEGYLLLKEKRAEKWLEILSGVAALDILTTLVITFVPSHRAYWYGLFIGSVEGVTAILAIVGKVPESAVVVGVFLIKI